MATGINKVILVGNLGKDVQVQTFENGIKKASFSVATDESYKDRSGQKVDRTEWHNVVMWRGLAEVAERYLRKGSKVYIEGRIRTRQYVDQQNITRYFTDIEAQNMVMLDRRDDSGGGYQGQGYGNQQYQQAPSQQAPQGAYNAPQQQSAPAPQQNPVQQQKPVQQAPFQQNPETAAPQNPPAANPDPTPFPQEPQQEDDLPF
jgi:single-strand DNA-binding protein